MTPKTCSVASCDKPTVALTYCDKHYRRFKRYGSPTAVSRLLPGTHERCTVPDCGRPHLSGGYCNRHYTRWRKYGDPLKAAFETAADGAPAAWIKSTALLHTGEDCLHYPFAKAKGYGQIWVEGRKWSAHRYVCTLAHGEAPTQSHAAAHLCGQSSCVSPSHLAWKTYSENEADKLGHGTLGRGERNSQSLLTAEQVLEIRSALGTHAEIAKAYGVSRRAISAIKNRSTWAWL